MCSCIFIIQIQNNQKSKDNDLNHIVYEVKHDPIYFADMRPVLTKWATSRQGNKRDVALWTFQKSMENKGISQGNNGFWNPNKPTTLTYKL